MKGYSFMYIFDHNEDVLSEHNILKSGLFIIKKYEDYDKLGNYSF
jgi:hypothetical protein